MLLYVAASQKGSRLILLLLAGGSVGVDRVAQEAALHKDPQEW